MRKLGATASTVDSDAAQAAEKACKYGLAVNERVRLWDISYSSFSTLRTMAFTLKRCDLVLEVEAHDDSGTLKTFAVRRECAATDKA